MRVISLNWENLGSAWAFWSHQFLAQRFFFIRMLIQDLTNIPDLVKTKLSIAINVFSFIDDKQYSYCMSYWAGRDGTDKCRLGSFGSFSKPLIWTSSLEAPYTYLNNKQYFLYRSCRAGGDETWYVQVPGWRHLWVHHRPQRSLGRGQGRYPRG